MKKVKFTSMDYGNFCDKATLYDALKEVAGGNIKMDYNEALKEVMKISKGHAKPTLVRMELDKFVVEEEKKDIQTICASYTDESMHEADDKKIVKLMTEMIANEIFEETERGLEKACKEIAKDI